MEPLKIDDLSQGALLLIDSAPIIYVLEDPSGARAPIQAAV
jgi:hypothetical protein